MNNLTINNSISGFFGAVNMDSSDKQPACQEDGSSDFLSILRSIIGGSFSGSDVTGTQSDVDVQQSAIVNSIYPTLLWLIQNISNTNILMQNQLNEKNEIGFTEIDPASIDTVLSLLNSISQVLKDKMMLKQNIDEGISTKNTEERKDGQILSEESEEGKKVTDTLVQALLSLLSNIYDAHPNKDNILETINEFLDKNGVTDMDVVSISDMARIKNTGKEGEDKLPALTLPGAKQKEEIEKLVVQKPVDNITTIQFVNNFYLNTEESAAKEDEDGENSNIRLAEDKVPDDFKFKTVNKDDKQNSMFFNNVQSGLRKEIDDNFQILMEKIPDISKEGDNKNRDTSFTNNKETGFILRDNISNDDMKTLLTRGEKLISELTVKQKNEAVEPENQDMKVLFKDSEYLSFSKNDYFEKSFVKEAEGQKVVKETAFASVMTEKIEKIAEQYSVKGASMDMIVRLKIDDKETLLVGLKNDGQRIVVDVKTTNEGIINILQTQKDTITRNLEEKNIYTNLYIDPDGNGSFERREARRENQRNDQDTGKQKDFIEFLEASA